MYNRKAFKQEAKQLMRASVPHFMLVALVYVLLTTGLSYVVTWLTDGSELLTGVLSVFLNILVWLFSIVLAVGFANYALRLSRREETGMGSLFHSFSFAGRSIGVELLSALFIFLWSMLAAVAFAVVAGILAAVSMLSASAAGSVLLIVLIAALYIAMIVVVVAIALRYAMASFALVDAPDAGVMEAIRRSIQMMRGYKGKYFVLELSFIGWFLLAGLISAVVLGIGFVVSGADLVAEDLAAMVNGLNLDSMDDLWMIDSLAGMVQELANRMSLWTLLADVLCLPLTLWLAVYRQTAAARFYNYVSGYDYHQYMNGQSAPNAPLTPPGQEPKQPKPPAGGYYNSVLPPENTDGEDET